MANHRIRQSDASLGRRAFLRGLGVAGGSALVADYLLPPGGAAQEFQLRAPEPNPKYGGTLRFATQSAPAHFDIHQSTTIGNIGTQAPMYDLLIRRDPRDADRIVPDLAHKWEISPDGKVYTFHLRKGVQFHDGAELTADDVKATYARIIWPPEGIVSPRRNLFSAVTEIRVLDPHRVEFRLREARATQFMLGAFASGWNVIVRKKTLDDNNQNLRQVMNYPGTGPFRHVSRRDKEVWILEKNPNYWNKGLPYLDRLEMYNLAISSPELASALLAGKIDYARGTDPQTARRAKETSGLASAPWYPRGIAAVWVNTKRKAFTDPRVRRALHLALDRQVLVDVVKDVAGMTPGGFLHPYAEWATPAAELANRLGYQKDTRAAVQEARRLLAEAGHPRGFRDVDFLLREWGPFRLLSVAIQAMLKEALNVETTLRVTQTTKWFEDAQAGNFDLTLGADISMLTDPSDFFHGWYGKDGSLNYARWESPAFEGLAKQIDGELDDAKRKALVRQAEAILEQEAPLIPVAWLLNYDAWYTYVKGHNPLAIRHDDVARWDTAWLAK
jgi:peptide/nickel transport system substrate-binding protein